jgi:hypothetical protein
MRAFRPDLALASTTLSYTVIQMAHTSLLLLSPPA